MGKGSAARIELGRSFHQMGTVNEKVCESDFVPLRDGTIICCSLAERKLLEGIHVWSNAFRQRGAELVVVLKANIINALNLMRPAIGSQYKLIKRGVTMRLFWLIKE